MSRKLGRGFYERADVETVARELLGKVLCTRRRGGVTAGRIVEVEAYAGEDDRACHAYGGRRTRRNDVMYERGGHAYVYLCYGLHVMFNVVANVERRADAVLVRALEPMEGEAMMWKRRKLPVGRGNVSSGPGVLAQALGLTLKDNREDLLGDSVWIEDRGVEAVAIARGPRIGVGYAGDHARRPWRFWVRGNRYVSSCRERKFPAGDCGASRAYAQEDGGRAVDSTPTAGPTATLPGSASSTRKKPSDWNS